MSQVIDLKTKKKNEELKQKEALKKEHAIVKSRLQEIPELAEKAEDHSISLAVIVQTAEGRLYTASYMDLDEVYSYIGIFERFKADLLEEISQTGKDVES